jgi:hypothetical protein
MTDPTRLPADLPAPVDDGAADHLPGLALPPVALAATTGATVALDGLGAGRNSPIGWACRPSRPAAGRATRA